MRALVGTATLLLTLALAQSAQAGPPKPGKCAFAPGSDPGGEAWILGGLALALVARGRSRREAAREAAGEGPA